MSWQEFEDFTGEIMAKFAVIFIWILFAVFAFFIIAGAFYLFSGPSAPVLPEVPR